MGAWVPKGKKVVATAGTAERLTSTQTLCCAVFIQALPGNTGRIVGGDSAVVASSLAGVPGFILGAPSGASIPSKSIGSNIKSYVFDAAEIYIDAMVNGEGVVWSIIAT